MLHDPHKMDTTLKKFESGVHDRQECGSNKSGYAAINSAYNTTDVHKLSSCIIQSSSRPLLHCRKKSFLSSDGLIYIFMKLTKIMPGICTYLMLLSRDTHISATLKSIIEASASAGNVIVTIVDLGGTFSIELYFMDIRLYHHANSFHSLKSFLINSGLTNKIIAIGYPTLPDRHMDIVNSLDTAMWCVPATRHLTYSSKNENYSVDHFVYPWSKSPLCSGFTLGEGKVTYSSEFERHKYIGLYNSYETMISSVPYGLSCTDCVELQSVAHNIKELIGKDSSADPRRHLKKASIDALEEMKAEIAKYTQQC